MKYELIPYGNKLLVKLNRVEEFKTPGGIIVPDNHSEESRIGEVIACGETVKNFKPGDRILVEWIIGTCIHLIAEGVSDDTNRIIPESQILCKVIEKE